MRKLASIRRISNIEPIEGADRIELATVDGWKVVVAKDVGHAVGDVVVYCEIDSFLPIKPEFEFLRKTSYKKMGDREGFRLKTIRLRGQISQGLILPIDTLKGKIDFGVGRRFEEHADSLIGQDVSELLGIVKYDPPIPAQLEGTVKGYFPGFLRKTDQERVQNIDFGEIQGSFSVTEKLDGTSFTCYKYNGEFGVCSRNLELIETNDNTYWQVARKLDLKNKIPEGYAFQGEIVGPGIQKNIYSLNEHSLFVFDMYDIKRETYLSISDVVDITSPLGLNTVPILNHDFNIPKDCQSIQDLLVMAENKSELNSEAEREGVVLRSKDYPNFTFKVISNKFLL